MGFIQFTVYKKKDKIVQNALTPTRALDNRIRMILSRFAHADKVYYKKSTSEQIKYLFTVDINRDKNKTGTPFQGDRWVLAAQYNTYVENIPLFESSSRWAHLKNTPYYPEPAKDSIKYVAPN